MAKYQSLFPAQYDTNANHAPQEGLDTDRQPEDILASQAVDLMEDAIYELEKFVGDGAGNFDFDGQVTINESGADKDFRVEGVGSVNAFFVQGSNGKIGIGTNTPTYELDVVGDVGLDEYLYHNDDTNTYLQFTPDRLRILIGDLDVLDVTEAGTDTVVWNEGAGDVDFRWEGVGAVNALFIQGSDGKVGIGTATPVERLHISFSKNAHNEGLRIDNLYPAGYGCAVRFYNTQNFGGNLTVEAGRINTVGRAAWSSDAATDSALDFDVVTAAALTTQFRIDHDGSLFAYNLSQITGAGLVVEWLAATQEIFAETSTNRHKADIRELDLDTSKLLNLVPKSYTDKETGRQEFGLIAEEVAEIMPEVVVFDEEDKPLGIKLTRLPIILLNELKKLNKRLLVLEA